MNVVSLSGASGIGTLDVTSGLGPNPEETAAVARRRKSGWEAHLEWERLWNEIQVEHSLAHTLTILGFDRKLWPDIATDSVPVETGAEAIAKPINDADLILVGAMLMAVGDDAEVHAPIAGIIRYGIDKSGRPGAVIETPEGARYLIAGLGQATGDNGRHVDVGDVIGFTPKSGEPSSAPHTGSDTKTERAVAQLVAGDTQSQIEIRKSSNYTLDVEHPEGASWPSQVELLLLGTPATIIAFALGGPPAAILVGGITLILAAARPQAQSETVVDSPDKLVITTGAAGTAVRAPTSGWISFAKEKSGSMTATILSDNGRRYTVVGLAPREPLPPPHYVRGGSVIGVTAEGPTDA